MQAALDLAQHAGPAYRDTHTPMMTQHLQRCRSFNPTEHKK